MTYQAIVASKDLAEQLKELIEKEYGEKLTDEDIQNILKDIVILREKQGEGKVNGDAKVNEVNGDAKVNEVNGDAKVNEVNGDTFMEIIQKNVKKNKEVKEGNKEEAKERKEEGNE